MNTGRVMYEKRNVETEPLQREILVHRAMYYKCDCCGTVYKFWLEKGLEYRMQDEIEPENHKPVPFCSSCLCGGITQHILWGCDEQLSEYRLLKDDENYFENTENERCGVSHIRNYGDAKIVKQALPKLEDICETLERDKAIDREEVYIKSNDFEDDPYGLAQISTSMLKKELRRRKRW